MSDLKGIYICFEFVISNKEKTSSGIGKKIYNQYLDFQKQGYIMTFYNPYVESKINLNAFSSRLFRRLPFYGHFLRLNLDKIINNEFDFVYIRKNWFIDYDIIKILREIKKKKCDTKIIMEVPTYPYDYEVMKKTMYPLLVKDRYYRKKLKKYVDRIVTYSNDEQIFNIKTININNGVNAKSEIIKCNYKNIDKDINIIAVSNLGFWHGYDRAIIGLSNYYKKNHNQCKKINLHIVGEGMELPKLKKMTEELSITKNVIFHGKKQGDALNEIYSISQIGFDSLGRHRSKVYYNSSLKAKEYLCKGLLIVSSVNSELDMDKNFKYLYKVPADDSPIDYEKILNFLTSIYSQNNYKDLYNNMISYAKEHFDFSVSFKPVVDYLEEEICS